MNIHATFDGTISKLKVVLRQLCVEDSETNGNWLSLLETAFLLSNSLAQSLCIDVTDKVELEKLAIELWNKTSLLKGKANLQSMAYAKLRHISFQVMMFLNESTNDEKSLKKQLVIFAASRHTQFELSFQTSVNFVPHEMGLKAARGWTSCKECEHADKVMAILCQTLQRLQSIIAEKGKASNLSESFWKEKEEMERDMLNILCLKAEVKFIQGQYSDAMAAVDQAKEILPKFLNQAAYLSMLCYNFGVDCYQDKQFEQGIPWLKESYNIGKDSPDIGNTSQARTLRLLANCYHESQTDGWQDAALNAVSLANQILWHCAGIYLKLHLLLLVKGTSMDIKQAMSEMLHHSDCDMDLCLTALHLLKKYQRSQVVFDMRQSIIHKFDMDPEINTLLVMMLDVFLNATDMQQAKIYTEECITAHNTGRRLNGTTIKQFHLLLWGKAAHYFESQSYLEAVTWYNYSLSLYSSLSQSEPNLGKLQRNLATCYINLRESSKAQSAIELAEKCEPHNMHTLYIAFKVALMTNDTEKALSVLQNLVASISDNKASEESTIICLAAQMALEQGKTHLAIPALECIILHSNEDKCIIIALRCLLRLLVTQLEQGASIAKKALLVHLRTAYHKLLCVKDKQTMPSAEIQEEALWFMKIAWNLALQSKDEAYCVKEFFSLCCQLLSLCAKDDRYYDRYQTCLVLTCAACLQLVRENKDKSSVEDLLEEVLLHIEEYRQAEQKTQTSLWAQGVGKATASRDMFLLMFEFEALTKLRDQRAHSVLERAIALPNSDPKLFHTLAALATDPPANNYRLGMRALKVAVRLHLQGESPDYGRCSVDVRNLIELSLNGSEEESLLYFKETLDMIEKRAQDKYPEMEALWLITKSWNCGLQHYNCGKFQEAEKWCSMSIRFLKFIPSMKDQYEDQMMAVYGEILSSLERQAVANSMEE